MLNKTGFRPVSWQQQGRGGATGSTTKWSFPLVTVQGDSGFNWKASNRLIVQPQAHFPLLGECCLSLASEGTCSISTSSGWTLGVVVSWWRSHWLMTDWRPGSMYVPLDEVVSGVGPTWFVVLLQLYPTWFDLGVSYLRKPIPRVFIRQINSHFNERKPSSQEKGLYRGGGAPSFIRSCGWEANNNLNIWIWTSICK